MQYTSAGECATMVGQSKNCSSLYGIKASLKSIIAYRRAHKFWDPILNS